MDWENNLTPGTAARFLEEFKEVSEACNQLAAECDSVTTESIMAAIASMEKDNSAKEVIDLVKGTLVVLRDIGIKNTIACLAVLPWLPDDDDTRERLANLAAFNAQQTETRERKHQQYMRENRL